MEHNSQRGFTLVELSIVLVIIGLIVGGVLVGQDLIAAARIRAMASQIEKFDAGAATFQAKYGARPGDLLQARATAFGLTTGVGDGDGVVEDQVGGANTNTFAGEIADFFDHLTDASLIPGVAANATPGTALGKGFWTVASFTGTPTVAPGYGSLLYYASVTASGGIIAQDVMTPHELFGFDSKLDDGIPETGQTIAIDDVTVSGGQITGAANGATECIVAGGGNYNVSIENNLCSALSRAQS